MNSTELITVDELAERLKVPKSWVYFHTRQSGPDVIPQIRTGKYIRFEYPAVLEWLKNSTSSKLE